MTGMRIKGGPAYRGNELVTEFIRKVNYYETDKMGITHHSNYVRYMEEARTELFEQMGISYELMGKAGLLLPVTELECKYRHSSTAGDRLRIEVRTLEYTGVRLVFGFKMYGEDGELIFTGKVTHGCTDAQGHPVIMRKFSPELDHGFKAMAKKDREE